MLDTITKPLVDSRGCRITVGAEPTAILWIGETALLTLGDGSVRQVDIGGELARHEVHDGAILSACRHPDGSSIVTGGDDSRVCRVAASGEISQLAKFERGWVEHLVASASSGLIVAGVGRQAIVWLKDATEPSHSYQMASTIGGLALERKGKRLAVSHYNGASLFYASGARSHRVALDWVGSHLACTLSADG